MRYQYLTAMSNSYYPIKHQPPSTEWNLPHNDGSIREIAVAHIIEKYDDLLNAKSMVILIGDGSTIELRGPRLHGEQRASKFFSIDDPDFFDKVKAFITSQPDISIPEITPEVQQIIDLLDKQ